jgi:hypothetical protein
MRWYNQSRIGKVPVGSYPFWATTALVEGRAGWNCTIFPSTQNYYITRRNCKMKRILSLVLVLALVLGSVPVAFAAEENAGEQLKSAGFVAGDQDGNLNEDQKLTREQMMVLIAEMNGVKEEAATFGIPADFSDVNENDWFAPYVWYAFYQGWTTGMGDGTFGAGLSVDSKMASTFMLKALGYEVADYNASVAQAAAVGIEVEESSAMTRGEGFVAMWSTVNLPKQGSEVSLGVELGKIEAPAEEVAEVTAGLDTVEAIGNTLVEVYLDADVDAAAIEAAEFVIVEKGTTTALEVKEVTAVGSDWVYVETAELTTGTGYTMTLGESTKNFTGIASSSTKPAVDSVKGTDTDRVEVVFDRTVDRATAEDIANYSVDKVGTVTGATLEDDNETVTLVVEGFTKVQSAKLTVENVLSVDGVAMSKTTKTFYSKFDKDAPDLDEVKKSTDNNVEVFLYFDDEHGVDKATALDLSNYKIDGLEILAAEVDDVDANGDDTDYWTEVKLTTSEQSKSKKYTVEVLYMLDGSSAANATTKTLSDTFYGGKADDSAPSLKDVTVNTLTEIEVEFTEDNYLDPATALDLSNYTSVKDEFDILDAQFKDEDDEELKIILTVSELEQGETYKLEVNNVADTFGNAMDDEERESFSLSSTAVIDAATYIESVTVTDLETLEITFNQAVTTETAEDPTNYTVDGGIGRAITAEQDDDDDAVVVVTFDEMSANKAYELTAVGVETFFGYATEDATINFIATSTEQDTEQPTVESVDNENRGILKVEFSEAMELGTLPVAVVQDEDDATSTASISAVEVIGENDEIVVFDASSLEGTTNGGTWEIVSFDDITDVAKLTPDYDANDESFDTDDDAYDAADEAYEFDGVYQEDINTIIVDFDEEVLIATSTLVINGVTFDLDVVDDVEVELTYASGTRFDDEDEITFTLDGNVTDLIGRVVADNTIELDWDADDDVAPELVEVRAINDRQIEVEYTEDISADDLGTYKLVDEDDDTVSISTVEAGDDDNVVLITVSSDLDSDVFYTLTQKTLAEDLSGNDADEVEDGIEFLGNSKQYVPNTIDGIAVINGAIVKVLDDEALPAGTYTVKSGSTAIYAFEWDGASTTTETTNATYASVDVSDDEEIIVTFSNMFYTFLEGQEFTFAIDADAGSDYDFSEDFDGVVEELEFGDISFTNNTVEVGSLSEDDDQTVYVWVNGVTETFTQNDDTLTLTDAGISSGDTVKVVVVDTASEVALFATDNVAVTE